MGLRGKPVGLTWKFTEPERREIIKRYLGGETMQSLGREAGVSKQGISLWLKARGVVARGRGPLLLPSRTRRCVRCGAMKRMGTAWRSLEKGTPSGFCGGDGVCRECRKEEHKEKLIGTSARQYRIKVEIKAGRMQKPGRCEVCGKTECKILGHHDSYAEEDVLNVRWVCYPCHLKIHSKVSL